MPTTSLQWRGNGVAIAGATAASYTPVAADDGKDLTCLVSATSSAGTAQAATAALKVSYAAPTAKAGALTDVSYDQNSGAKTVAAAAAFTGAGLSYAVTGAGASIDAATGVVTLSTNTLVSASAVTVTASNSGGTATSSFKVTVKAVLTAPALVTAPALSGTGKIGTAVTVSCRQLERQSGADDQPAVARQRRGHRRGHRGELHPGGGRRRQGPDLPGQRHQQRRHRPGGHRGAEGELCRPDREGRRPDRRELSTRTPARRRSPRRRPSPARG